MNSAAQFKGFIYGETVIEWVGRELGTVFEPTQTRAIGFIVDGEINAGIVYTDWNRQSVICHWAIRGRTSRKWLWYIHHYAFVELGVYKVIAPIWSTNVRMLAIASKMGFMEEAILKGVQPDGDVSLFTMTAHQSRY